MTMSVTIEGLEEVIKKTDPKILRKPLRTFFTNAGLETLREGAIHAPVDTSRLRSSLLKGGASNIWEMDSSPLPMWLKVGTGVQSYPKILDTDPRYHYRRGPFRGAPTMGFFSNVPGIIKNRYAALVGELKKAIAKGWH